MYINYRCGEWINIQLKAIEKTYNYYAILIKVNYIMFTSIISWFCSWEF